MNSGGTRKSISSAYANISGTRKQIFPYSATTIYFNRIDFTDGSNNISVTTSSFNSGFTTDYLSSDELSYIVDLILTKESNGYYNVNGSVNATELQYNIYFRARDTAIQLYRNRNDSSNGDISLFVLGFK